MEKNLDFRITEACPGRALYVGDDDALYIARKYEVYRSNDWGKTWQLDCYVPTAGWRSQLMNVRLAARLLRYDIVVFRVLADGARIAVARHGVYRAEPGETRMTQVFPITRGSRPINLAVDGNRVLFGEYGDAYQNSEAYLYVSEDYGKNFEVGYRFPAGSIRHVHNIQVDPYRNVYWVLVGDYDKEPGIGVLSKDLRTLEWLSRGSQMCRAVQLLIEPDCLIYGTDSDMVSNCILHMDKNSGKVIELAPMDGSSIYATKFGPLRVISTAVENRLTCPSGECSLYVSWNGFDWHRAAVHKKDRYSSFYFQMGMLVLPYAYNSRPVGIFSGQAITPGEDRVSFLEFFPPD